MAPRSAERDPLWSAAIAVLHDNDLGEWTKPAPRLYPHQWSWDSAIVAIGLAHLDPDRALRELESLFAAQWSDGRVPHIVFNPAAYDYFPGPDRWATAELAVAAPKAPATSGLVQPPVHALALERIQQTRRDSRVEQLYVRMLAWHRYLASARDPTGSGLLTIYHPWESGTDNSPRWDAPLARVDVGVVLPYVRHDLKHVADASQRPTQAEYDRYLWLVETLKRVGYDDAAAHREHPFLIKDVLMTAIFALANITLAELGQQLRRPEAERRELLDLAERASKAVQAAWDPAEKLALDWDVRAGEPVRVRTCAGLAPLILPDCPPDLLEACLDRLRSDWFVGVPGLAFRVVPSTAPGSPGFRARAYWRGPTWPIINWLIWLGLRRTSHAPVAASLREEYLALLRRPEARFAEYFEPFTAEPLGSLDQSWTAAVALDWLSEE